jgi:amino acid transporter
VLAATAVVNIVGVRLFSRINSVAVLAEVVAALVIAVAVAIAYAIKPDHPVTILFSTGGVHGGAMWGGRHGSAGHGPVLADRI